MVSINKLSNAKRAQVVRCLVEGNSIRATVRMTGVAKNTTSKLIVAGVASVLRGQAPLRLPLAVPTRAPRTAALD
jgi:hypothetical protein